MIYLYILVMAGTTYLIRMLPLTLFQQKIHNRFIRSFLYYVPYVCLTTMTLPSILYSTSSIISAGVGLIIAIVLSLNKKGLVTVAASSCLGVFIVECFLI